MAYDLIGARAAKIPDTEIIAHLAEVQGYRLDEARAAGVPDNEILSDLLSVEGIAPTKVSTEYTPPAEQTPLPTSEVQPVASHVPGERILPRRGALTVAREKIVPTRPKGVLDTVGRVLTPLVPMIGAGIGKFAGDTAQWTGDAIAAGGNVIRDALDMKPGEENALQKVGKYISDTYDNELKGWRERNYLDPQDNVVASGIRSGLQSTGEMAATWPLAWAKYGKALASGMTATEAALSAGKVTLGTLSAKTGAESYDKFADRGHSFTAATAGAATDALIEQKTEEMESLSFFQYLADPRKMGLKAVAKAVGKLGVIGQFTEQLATLGQDMTDKIMGDPNMTLEQKQQTITDHFNKVGKDGKTDFERNVVETAIATATMTAVMGGVGGGAKYLSGRKRGNLDAEQGQEDPLAETAKNEDGTAQESEEEKAAGDTTVQADITSSAGGVGQQRNLPARTEQPKTDLAARILSSHRGGTNGESGATNMPEVQETLSTGNERETAVLGVQPQADAGTGGSTEIKVQEVPSEKAEVSKNIDATVRGADKAISEVIGQSGRDNGFNVRGETKPASPEEDTPSRGEPTSDVGGIIPEDQPDKKILSHIKESKKPVKVADLKEQYSKETLNRLAENGLIRFPGRGVVELGKAGEAKLKETALETKETVQADNIRREPGAVESATGDSQAVDFPHQGDLHADDLAKKLEAGGLTADNELHREIVTERRQRERAPDPETGLIAREHHNPTLDRAHKVAIDTNEPFAYADVDLANLGGLNEHAGGNAAANVHMKGMLDIVDQAVRKVYPKAQVMRKGGDEFAVFAPGVSKEDLGAVLAKAQDKVRLYTKEQGLDQITRKGEKGAYGTGIHYGAVDLREFETADDAKIAADSLTLSDKNARKEAHNVNKRKTEQVGAVPPQRQTGSTEGSVKTEVTADKEGAGQEIREPWEKTVHDYIFSQPKKEAEKAKNLKKYTDGIIAEHRDAVVRAIAEGKPVPAEVLADYPDLQPTEPVTVREEEKPEAYTLPAEYTLSVHNDLFKALREGEPVTPETVQQAFKALRENGTGIKAELAKLKKDDLLKKVDSYRYKNENKDTIVKAAYNTMITRFAYLDGVDSIMWSHGQKTEDVAQKRVDALTPEHLKAYAEENTKAQEAYKERMQSLVKSVKDPETYEEFQNYFSMKRDGGVSMKDARKQLTLEQREKFDTLAAAKSRETRKADQAAKKTEVHVAAQTTEGQVIETKHTKTGEPLFVVKAADRVEREIYNEWNATAKRLGGYYSSFRGNGAVPGFQFRDRAGADAFLKFLGGDVADAKEKLAERRDAFADDRSQSAVERLNEMADSLEERASEELNRDRKANTAKRAGQAASAIANAERGIAMAKTMRNLAAHIESGKAVYLDRVRTKAQIEMLESMANVAHYTTVQETMKDAGYDERENARKSPPVKADIDAAEYPSFTAYRSDLARLGREMEEIDGTKKLGADLTKIANDVSTAYLKFAKENLHKVSTFAKKNASGETAGLAAFNTRDAALTAISRSGYKGKATVVSFKRGEHLVVMGPEMAKEAGIWKGDDDKLITLAPAFVEQILAKNKTIGKRNRLSVPWTFEATQEKRVRLKSMQIETGPELRSALREYLDARETPKAPDKVKELERAMVGRRNDGLDFFPTPPGTSQEMIETADIQEGMSVLEPSAGMGHISDQIREAGHEPDVVEMASDRRELLEAKGYNLVGRDFMEVEGKYDRIIMNPPFSNRRDAEHVQHAFTLLRPGGRVVALMGEGVFFGQDKKAVQFREWLDSVGGTSEKLPEGTFQDPSLPVTTSVNGRLVVVDAPGEYVPGTKEEPAEETANIPTFTEAKGGEIYQTKVNHDGETVTMYAVPHGNPRGFGDTLHMTYVEAIQEQKRWTEQKAANDERLARVREQEAAEKEKADAKLAERNDLNGFGDDLNPMQKGKVVASLNKEMLFDGQVMTIKAKVEELVAAGAKTRTFEEDKIKPMTRTQFSRASQREQDAHEKRVREGGKQTVYLVDDHVLGKTAYDYANYLMARETANDQTRAQEETGTVTSAEDSGNSVSSSGEGSEGGGSFTLEDIPAGLEVKTTAVTESGKKVKAPENAREAWKRLNEEVDQMESVVRCLET